MVSKKKQFKQNLARQQAQYTKYRKHLKPNALSCRDIMYNFLVSCRCLNYSPSLLSSKMKA
jgi:hypothetical protein